MRPNQASAALPLLADAPASPAKRRSGAAGAPPAFKIGGTPPGSPPAAFLIWSHHNRLQLFG